MPKNTLKDLQERYAAKQTDLRTLKTAFDNADESAKTAAREALTAGLAAAEALADDIKLAQQFEQHRSDNPTGDTAGKTAEEIAAMTPGERNSDKVSPLLNPDAKGYRIGKVILAMGNREALTGVEAEVAQELQKRKRTGSETRGHLIPLTLQFQAMSERRANSMANMAGLSDKEFRELNAATTGTAALPTSLSGTLIDLLRNQAVALRAGVTLLSGLEGSFEMAKVDGSPVFAWGGEGFTPGETSGSINSKVTFAQKTVSARSKVTRRFALQSLHSLDAENWQRQQLLIYLALGIDWGILHGPGTANNLLGIFENPNVGVIGNGTNGGPLTFGKLVDMETQVADANAELGEGRYLTNARVRGQGKQSLKFASAGSATIWDGNMMNGHDALMSNQIRKDYTKGSGTALSGAAYGDFSQAVLGTWSGADLLVDPFTNAGEGATNIYLHQDVDMQVLHDEAFSVMKDVNAQLA